MPKLAIFFKEQLQNCDTELWELLQRTAAETSQVLEKWLMQSLLHVTDHEHLKICVVSSPPSFSVLQFITDLREEEQSYLAKGLFSLHEKSIKEIVLFLNLVYYIIIILTL